MGFQVLVTFVDTLGRPHLSKGFLKEAKEIAHQVISEWKHYAESEFPIIGLEPSEILTAKDEFLDLCEDEYLKDAQQIAKHCYTFEEFLAVNIERIPRAKLSESVIIHQHCHSKALTKKGLSSKVLSHIGFEVNELDSGCCGMAGSFGYEKDKYDLSMEIGSQRLFPAIIEDKKRSNVCASGFSCRHQIHDGTGFKAKHISVLISEKI
jgi:Fe-S oxidoreductase